MIASDPETFGFCGLFVTIFALFGVGVVLSGVVGVVLPGVVGTGVGAGVGAGVDVGIGVHLPSFEEYVCPFFKVILYPEAPSQTHDPTCFVIAPPKNTNVLLLKNTCLEPFFSICN
jgi:hypothetical protein